MKKAKDNSAMLNELLDAAADAVMASSDSEILEEARQIYSDPDARVQDLRAMAIERIASAKRQRLLRARAELDATPERNTRVTKPAWTQELRSRINALLPNPSSMEDRLTLAFRNGEQMSDADLESLLEDLEELAERLDKKEE